jgi:hypothetical protein
MVYPQSVDIKSVRFPAAPEREQQLVQAIKNRAPRELKDISLDRMEAALQATEAARNVKTFELDNTPPQVFLRTKPSILAYVDGEPAWTSRFSTAGWKAGLCRIRSRSRRAIPGTSRRP